MPLYFESQMWPGTVKQAEVGLNVSVTRERLAVRRNLAPRRLTANS